MASGSVDERGQIDPCAARSTYLKPGSSSLAENEIRGSGDFAFGVKLTAFVCEEGVLIAEKADAVVSLVRSLGRKSKCLATLAVGVFEVQVVPGESAYYFPAWRKQAKSILTS